MSELKYIFVRDLNTGVGRLDTLVVFPDFISHDQMTRNIGKTKDDIIGAGFCVIGHDKETTRCYGKSVSLGKETTNECTYQLRRMTGVIDPFLDE